MEAFAIDASNTRDIASSLLDERGKLRVVDAAALATTDPEERLLFGVRHGCYGFVTIELSDFLRERIGGRKAIEVGVDMAPSRRHWASGPRTTASKRSLH